MVEVLGYELHCLAAFWQRRIINKESVPVILIFGQPGNVLDDDGRQPKKKPVPVHMGISQKAVNRILGKILMESPHLDLVVHAHWAEHKIENVEHDDTDRNTFFLVCAAFSKQFYNFKTVNEP